MRSLSLALAISILTILVSSEAICGGPFHVDEGYLTGNAIRWKTNVELGKPELKWYIDSGDLTDVITGATAKDWITAEFNKWGGVTIPDVSGNSIATTNIAITFGGTLNQDLNDQTAGAYIDKKYIEEPKTVVVLDKDGSITADRFGAENIGKILGFSAITDYTTSTIYKGYVVLNGYVLSHNIVTSDLYKTTMLHEMGHLLNLDHTQINHDLALACTLGGACEGATHIATMYPYLLTGSQGLLTRDDKITISSIYPSEDFANSFCTIRGSIVDTFGRPMKAVNVIASRVGEGDTTARVDMRSSVTGAEYPVCYGDTNGNNGGRYVLKGIVPGRSYVVTYETIDPEFTDESGLNPLNDMPHDIDPGQIYGPNCVTTVSCSSGGEIIDMPVTVVATEQNPCPDLPLISIEGSCSIPDPPSGASSSTKSCSLIPDSTINFDRNVFMMEILLLISGVLSLVIRRKRVGVQR